MAYKHKLFVCILQEKKKRFYDFVLIGFSFMVQVLFFSRKSYFSLFKTSAAYNSSIYQRKVTKNRNKKIASPAPY